MLAIADVTQILSGNLCPSQLSDSQWQQLLLLLREAKLLASLYHRLVDVGSFDKVPDAIKSHLVSSSIYAKRQAKQVRFECDQVVQIGQSIDCQVYFLKGASYLLTNSFNSKGRICNDIDVLTDKSRITELEQALLDKGWRQEEVDDYDEKYYRQWAHEIPPLYHPFRGTVLDVHHNLFLPISGRAPNIGLFTDESQKATSGKVLSEHGIVMHSIIHLFMNEDFDSAFRDLYDIYCLVEHRQSDDVFWDNLVSLASQSGFRYELACSIHALYIYYDVNVPSRVNAELQKDLNSRIKKLFYYRLFIQAIVPRHPSVQTGVHKLSRFLVYLRGHFVKMPFTVLIKHLCVKSFRSVTSHMLGNESVEAK